MSSDHQISLNQGNVLIIAEVGVNHNGSITLAKELIDAAMTAGADAVKFQTFISDHLATRNAKKADYQMTSKSTGKSQLAMLKQLELSKPDHIDLLNTCKKKGLQFLSSPFDVESIELLNTLGLSIFKIPSGEINNLPYLRKIGSLNKKLILSTGMSHIGEVEQALSILQAAGTPKTQIIVMHCNTAYPTPLEDVNLRAMLTIRNTFNVKVGYSDHTTGIDMPTAAVAMGAEVIEKHFTLDNDMPGPDHKASLNPRDFKKMVVSIRNVEKALGSDIKAPTPSELKNRPLVRKSIVASKAIKKGELFSEENITVKRPDGGMSPLLWDDVIGETAKRNYNPDDQI